VLLLQVCSGGTYGPLSGTSAATPTFAGLISVINDDLISQGKASVGTTLVVVVVVVAAAAADVVAAATVLLWLPTVCANVSENDSNIH